MIAKRPFSFNWFAFLQFCRGNSVQKSLAVMFQPTCLFAELYYALPMTILFSNLSQCQFINDQICELPFYLDEFYDIFMYSMPILACHSGNINYFIFLKFFMWNRFGQSASAPDPLAFHEFFMAWRKRVNHATFTHPEWTACPSTVRTRCSPAIWENKRGARCHFHFLRCDQICFIFQRINYTFYCLKHKY